MVKRKLSIRLKIDGGEWMFFGEHARVGLFFWRNRKRWLTMFTAMLALRSDEVKARLSDIETKVGREILDRKAQASSRRKLYRLKSDVEVEE